MTEEKCKNCEILERQLLNHGAQIHWLSGQLGITNNHFERLLSIQERIVQMIEKEAKKHIKEPDNDT